MNSRAFGAIYEAGKYLWTDKGEHIVKLENIAEIIAGKQAGKDELMDRGDTLYLSAKDISPSGALKAGENRYLKISSERNQKAMIKSGDILLVCIGANIGLVSQYTADQSAMAGSSLFIIRSEEPGLFEKLSAKTEEIKSLAKGVAMLRLSIKDMKEFEL